MDRSYKVIISGAVIGLILALSQPLYNLGILIFPGLVLFFLVLKINKSHSFWLGYIAGLIYFLSRFLCLGHHSRSAGFNLGHQRRIMESAGPENLLECSSDFPGRIYCF